MLLSCSINEMLDDVDHGYKSPVKMMQSGEIAAHWEESSREYEESLALDRAKDESLRAKEAEERKKERKRKREEQNEVCKLSRCCDCASFICVHIIKIDLDIFGSDGAGTFTIGGDETLYGNCAAACRGSRAERADAKEGGSPP